MTDRVYWFPGKKYGWGWGLPVTWQGWAVFIGYFALLLGGVAFIDPRVSPGGYATYATVLSTVLVLVCWFKGEPPKWRWGQARRPPRRASSREPGHRDRRR